MEKLGPTPTWKTKKVLISSLTYYDKNPRKDREGGPEALEESITKFGYIWEVVINADNEQTVIAGHQRIEDAIRRGQTEIEVKIPDRKLLPKEVEELNLRLNVDAGKYDAQKIAEFGLYDLCLDVGVDFTGIDMALGMAKEIEEPKPAPKEKRPIECPHCGEYF